MKYAPLTCDECGDTTEYDHSTGAYEPRVLCEVCHTVELWHEWMQLVGAMD